MITNRKLALKLDEALASLEEARFKFWLRTEVWPDAVMLWVDEAYRIAMMDSSRAWPNGSGSSLPS